MEIHAEHCLAAIAHLLKFPALSYSITLARRQQKRQEAELINFVKQENSIVKAQFQLCLYISSLFSAPKCIFLRVRIPTYWALLLRWSNHVIESDVPLNS